MKLYYWLEDKTLGTLIRLLCKHEYITEPRGYAPYGVTFCKKCGKDWGNCRD